MKQRIDTLEGQVENADGESMVKLEAAAKTMGFDFGVLVDEILRQAQRCHQKSG